MNIPKKLLAGLVGIAGLVLLVAATNKDILVQADLLKRVDSPMEQKLRTIDSCLREANHAAEAFCSTADRTYSERYARQVERIENTLLSFSVLADNGKDTAFAEEFQLKWNEAKEIGNKLSAIVARKRSAEYRLLSLADRLDDLCDLAAQEQLSASSVDLPAKQQAIRELETSFRIAIDAGIQRQLLVPHMNRGELADDSTLAMSNQLVDAEERWNTYRSLAAADHTPSLIEHFSELWIQLESAARQFASNQSLVAQQFNSLSTNLMLASKMAKSQLEENVLLRIQNREESMRIAKLGTVATSLIAGVCAIFLCFIIARSFDGSVRRLKIAASEFGKGNLAYRINSPINDELSRAFDQMADDLQTASQQMQLEVFERKIAEEALRKAEQKSRALLDGSPVCNKIIDADCRLQYMSAAGQKQLKIADIEALYGKRYPPECYPETVRAPLCEHLDLAIAGKCTNVESPILDTEGNELWYDTSFVPVFDDDGLVEYVIASSVEITERKKAEETTRQATKILEMALAQSPSGILIASAPDGIIKLANQAALDIRGGDPSLLTEIDISQHATNWQVHRHDGSPYRPEQLPLSRSVLHGETVRDEELVIRDEDGNDHWINANAAPLYDDHGRVAAGIVVLHDVSDRKQMLTRMQELAFHDTLTGLPNRASILNSIQESIDRGEDNHFALLFLDIDRFKLINDSLGHDVGDELLKEIAHRLRTIVRTTDEIMIPARLGGDEFVILLDDLASPSSANFVAERILDVLSQDHRLSGQSTHASASIGVVTSEHRFESASEMLRDADLAMYESKSAGKACYTVFDQPLREKVQARHQIENEMRDGMSRGEFVLVYQPIISLATGEMEGAEALLRWMHPERGMISGDEFIPVAEETGMIISLGTEIINDVCRQLARWQKMQQGVEQSFCIHVNVSRKQLLSPSLTSIVSQALVDNCVRPESLHLEMTETTVMEDAKTAIAILNDLRQLGVKIDIDDFGTGYSSLSCVHEFPIDVLKIDRSFIADIEQTRELEALLQAVVTLAENLNLSIVAEGIENFQQLQLLQELGCQLGQGYLFAKPMSPDELERLIGSRFRTKPDNHSLV